MHLSIKRDHGCARPQSGQAFSTEIEGHHFFSAPPVRSGSAAESPGSSAFSRDARAVLRGSRGTRHAVETAIDLSRTSGAWEDMPAEIPTWDEMRRGCGLEMRQCG